MIPWRTFWSSFLRIFGVFVAPVHARCPYNRAHSFPRSLALRSISLRVGLSVLPTMSFRILSNNTGDPSG